MTPPSERGSQAGAGRSGEARPPGVPHAMSKPPHESQPGAREDLGLAALRRSDALGDADLSALWARISPCTLRERRTWRTKLRDLPTAKRIALAVTGAFVVATLALLIGGMRLDMGAQTVLRYVVAMLGILALTAATFAVSLRGHHQKPLGWRGLVVVASAILVPVGLAVMPWLWAPPPEMAGVPVSHVCLQLGISTGLIAAGIAWLFQRSDMNVWIRALSAAGGGGLVGFAMLQLHCPAHDATHLLIGHAGVGLFLVIVTTIVVAVRRGRAR